MEYQVYNMDYTKKVWNTESYFSNCVLSTVEQGIYKVGAAVVSVFEALKNALFFVYNNVIALSVNFVASCFCPTEEEAPAADKVAADKAAADKAAADKVVAEKAAAEKAAAEKAAADLVAKTTYSAPAVEPTLYEATKDCCFAKGRWVVAAVKSIFSCSKCCKSEAVAPAAVVKVEANADKTKVEVDVKAAPAPTATAVKV